MCILYVCIVCDWGLAGFQTSVLIVELCVSVCTSTCVYVCVETVVKGMYGCLNLVNHTVKAIIRTTYSFLHWQTHLYTHTSTHIQKLDLMEVRQRG